MSLDRSCNYDHISDNEIDNAILFDGWCNDYLSWPTSLWENYAAGIPSSNLNANAYHIKYLASKIAEAGAWVGRPIEFYPNGHVREGNHRYRALKYLSRKGIVINEESAFN